jgi:hypothetical protein
MKNTTKIVPGVSPEDGRAEIERSEMSESEKLADPKNEEFAVAPEQPTTCVLKVDGGRGFIVEYRLPIPPDSRIEFGPQKYIPKRLVVTAAHCLPNLPPAHSCPSLSDKTYPLLGNLDGSKSGVYAECLYVNPVADIAVLGCPDEQERGYDPDLYHELTDDAPVLQIANARSGPGWVLSIERRWVPTTLELCWSFYGSSLSIDPTVAGQSGSPILNRAGRVVGVVVVGWETVNNKGERRNERAGSQPILSRDLPGWLLHP